jgi:hypothetical protein
MAERPSRRRRPIRVQVQTERVEGNIELSEIVARLERGATSSARRAKRDPDVPQEIVDRFTNVSRLARQLAAELSELQTRGHRLRPPTQRQRPR